MQNAGVYLQPFSLVRKSESMNVEAMKETIQSFIIREQWCGVDFLRLTSHAILLVLVGTFS